MPNAPTSSPRPSTVLLPDGDIASAGPTIHGQVRVYHHDRTLGCGPWFFAVEQVRRGDDATLTDADRAAMVAYDDRCAAKRAKEEGEARLFHALWSQVEAEERAGRTARRERAVAA